MNRTAIILAAASALAASAVPAFADRQPTAEERTAIEAALLAAGYTSWENIELEDDGSVWEVDDARGPDGREFDLHLKPGTFEILEADAD